MEHNIYVNVFKGDFNMKGISKPQIFKLHGSIAPQMFLIRNDGIVYFDKINRHEGRFCINTGDENKVLLEVGEGEGRISSKNNFYLFQFKENTIITEHLASGEKNMELKLKGIFFDIEKDELGNYICLGNVDNRTTIKIINKNMAEIANICPGNLMFGSCLYLENEDIYLGGFDGSNKFKILKLNYIGYRLQEWTINVNSCDRIIGKIARFEDYLIIAVTGKVDSIVALNMENGSINEIPLVDFGIKTFFDFNIKGHDIYMLDGRDIYKWNISDILFCPNKKHNKHYKKDQGLLSYQYLMYSEGLVHQLESNFKLTIPFALAGLIVLFYAASETLLPVYNTFLFGICFLWIVHFTTAISKNIFFFLDKAARIHQLLEIYCVNSLPKPYKMPLFCAITAFSFLYLILYPKPNIFYSLIFSTVVFWVFYIIEKKSIDLIKIKNSEVIIELLHEDDESFIEYLKASIEQLRRKNCEKYCIDILIDGILKDNIIQKWAQSRRGIINEIDEAVIQKDKIRAVLDMNKRDIKYSRLSIIMDYICFTKREVNIREIQIGLKDDKG